MSQVEAADLLRESLEGLLDSLGLKAVLTAIATFLVGLMGGWDAPLELLVLLIILDWFGGIFAAGCNGKLSSKAGLRGIAKKSGYFVLVIIAYEFDKILGIQPPLTHSIVVIFLCVNEMLSIMENLSVAGVPIPHFFRDKIEVARRLLDAGGDPADLPAELAKAEDAKAEEEKPDERSEHDGPELPAGERSPGRERPDDII